MADGAAYLVDHLLPREADYRQWTLSLPYGLRARVLRDKSLASVVLAVFVRSVFADLRRRARTLDVPRGSPGAVTYESECVITLCIVLCPQCGDRLRVLACYPIPRSPRRSSLTWASPPQSRRSHPLAHRLTSSTCRGRDRRAAVAVPHRTARHVAAWSTLDETLARPPSCRTRPLSIPVRVFEPPWSARRKPLRIAYPFCAVGRRARLLVRGPCDHARELRGAAAEGRRDVHARDVRARRE